MEVCDCEKRICRHRLLLAFGMVVIGISGFILFELVYHAVIGH